MMKRYLLATALCLACATPAYATSCDAALDAMLNASEKENDWKFVHKSYESYVKAAKCDQGEVSQGYDGLVTEMLAGKTASYKELAALADKDAAFGDFVVKHITSNTPEDVLQDIKQNAKSGCPKDAGKLCDSINSAAMNASKAN